MKVSIKRTEPSEADALAQIQKAAFKPLYDRYCEPGNPYLRGAEDILRRLNKSNRYYTILYGDKAVGGIFYRLRGKRSHTEEIAPGEYYLARVFIHPDYQNRGIAKTAILLCEKEFPDAKVYYVDFPVDLDKNRKCYENAGYCDTGKRICVEGAPELAVFKKAVTDHFDTSGVSLPEVFEVDSAELPECLRVIHKSFATVAKAFGLTEENCPRHTSFMPLSFLETQLNWGWHMFGLYAGGEIIGYMSLSKEDDDVFELHNLAVLPEYRHNGFGKLLLDRSKETVRFLGGNKIKIGIIEESTVLKNWYIANGFVHVGTKKFDHLPFTSGYLEWRVR